jgi:predicted dehydrogenase
MARRTNRRQFLKGTLAGVGFWAAGGVSLADSKSPNEKLNIACIGVGGKGSSDCDQAGGQGNIVAICDIDEQHLEAKAQKFPQAKKYTDFRKMLEEMDKQIDAVTVSTPDHTHAPASAMAMRMKKHVYCQKPLTHSVHEARVLRETAKKMGLCTQMGNQGTAEDGLREAVELVQAGLLGPVREVHVWTNRPIWPQAPDVKQRPAPTPVPKHVHWDEWLGPAPFRPYAQYDPSVKNRFGGRLGAYHDFHWRGWWDFGTGALGDMGCHTANMAFMALKLGYPTTVAAECGDLNLETCPSWARVVLEFPARDEMVPCKFYWYEGRKDGVLVHPPQELLGKVLKKGQKLASSGSILVGDKGILFSPNDYGARFVLLPEAQFKEVKKPERRLPRNGGGDPGMKAEWVRAIRENKPQLALSNFDYAGLLTEAILLGNVAMRVGKKLEWDGPNCKAINAPEADQYLKREYRKGYSL